MSYIYIKDRKVALFKESVVKDANDNMIIIREYMHPENKKIIAYFRQLTSNESMQNNALIDAAFYLAVLNNRECQIGDYIEFKDLCYRIVSIDRFELKQTDMKIRLANGEKRHYDEIIYKGWQ